MAATDAGAAVAPAYDLLVVLDATGSMTSYIKALKRSLPQIIGMSALTDCFQRIGVVVYRDYWCTGAVTEWSGWCSPSGSWTGPDLVSEATVITMASEIQAHGNSDWNEAAKTGLALAYSKMRADATTIILFYADAPPHFKAKEGPNYPRELEALSKEDSYGGTGKLFLDWTSCATTLCSGDKKATVFSFVDPSSPDDWSPYLYLSTRSGGVCFQPYEIEAETVSQLTLATLLAWMNLGKGIQVHKPIGDALRYRDTSGIGNETSEDSLHLARNFFITNSRHGRSSSVEENVENVAVSMNNLRKVMTTQGPDMPDFAKRYVADAGYKTLVAAQLRSIIARDVSSISLNPIFGTLWRVVCNDRESDHRMELITLFGAHVERVSDAKEKQRLKSWLDESYNYATEIRETIDRIPKDEQFPAVYLDPTMGFTQSKAEGGPVQRLTREELLEIGRSCDATILRRLGKVLTQLSFVTTEADLPAHIRATKSSKVPRIPLSLANPKHGRRFWELLLHAVLPGTMLARRPAALLAALALRMGIMALRDVADQELKAYRDSWNRLEIPETWNMGCLKLLLGADRDFEARVEKGITTRAYPADRILTEEDHRLFKALVDYKMLELNLKTTLQATVSWAPEKSQAGLGPVVVCQACQFPRSVTIMASNNICGLCDPVGLQTCNCAACIPGEARDAFLHANVSKTIDENAQGFWVECSRRQCCAQYVVYNTKHLKVRPKCFYCRASDRGDAPVVECSKCLSRIIWPEEYRPKGFDVGKFECPACVSKVKTVVSKETAPWQINQENGTRWMLQDDEGAIAEPLKGRSVFYTASHCDLEKLATQVSILPEGATTLKLNGKYIQNVDELKDSLRGWISSRRVESGVCSLCFSDERKASLQRACGRSGCHQLVCADCKEGWYGINRRGRVINVAALSCPFCRRQPAAKTIRGLGIGLSGLGNVQEAVAEAGSWIYAWCDGCGFAKQFMERVCGGPAGRGPEVRDWQCEDCVEAREKNTAIRRELRRLAIKECPGCGVTTQKMSGCDHIYCPCGVHWCFACGEAPEGDIYAHMSTVHGGWGLQEELDDWESD